MLLCDGIAPSCLWRSGLSWFLSRSRFFARFEAARVFTFSSLGGQLSLQKLSDLILLVLKYSTSLGQSVGFGATIGTVIGASVGHRPRGAPIGAAIGAAIAACAAKLAPRKFRACAMTLLILGIAIATQWENQRLGRAAGILEFGQRTVQAIERFRSLNLQPASGSNILLKSSFPFKNEWTPLFIASLVWNDHSLQIWLEGKNKLSQQQLTKVNYVILFTESEAKLLRSPESPQL